MTLQHRRTSLGYLFVWGLREGFPRPNEQFRRGFLSQRRRPELSASGGSITKEMPAGSITWGATSVDLFSIGRSDGHFGPAYPEV